LLLFVFLLPYCFLLLHFASVSLDASVVAAFAASLCFLSRLTLWLSCALLSSCFIPSFVLVALGASFCFSFCCCLCSWRSYCFLVLPFASVFFSLFVVAAFAASFRVPSLLSFLLVSSLLLLLLPFDYVFAAVYVLAVFTASSCFLLRRFFLLFVLLLLLLLPFASCRCCFWGNTKMDLE
jgi:hypothetical protein